MVGGVRRVLQASHFRLDESLRGDFSRVSEDLRSAIADARFAAVQNAFQLAISHRVDAVVLAGELGSIQFLPRITWFLKDQFEKLRRHGIEVISFVQPVNHPLWQVAFSQTHQSLTTHDPDERKYDPSLIIELLDSTHVPAALRYRRRKQEECLIVPIHEIQASSRTDHGPFQVDIIEIDSHSQTAVVPHSVESIRFCRVELILPESISDAACLNWVAAEIVRQTKLIEAKAVPRIVTADISCAPRMSFATSRSKLMTDLQRTLNALSSQIVLSDLTVNWTHSENPQPLSDRVAVAIRELSTLENSELTTSLPKLPHALSKRQLDRVKQTVAQRLPAFLNSETAPALEEFLF